MLALISIAENSETILIPFEEMEKFGFKNGDKVELIINENEEIVLRSKQNERRKRILEATREIIAERRSALIELGKGHQ